MAGRPVCGPLFDKVPPDALRAWAAARLPLSPEGCARVAEARSWYDLHRAIFGNPDFCRDILVAGAAAAGLAGAPPPKARPVAQAEDIAFLYRIFLGREGERENREDKKIGRTKKSVEPSFRHSQLYPVTRVRADRPGPHDGGSSGLRPAV